MGDVFVLRECVFNRCVCVCVFMVGVLNVTVFKDNFEM